MSVLRIIENIVVGDFKTLARSISVVENETDGYDKLLQQLPIGNTRIIGVTGSPGAGKSTLTDALIGVWVKEGKKVAVICVDPSSPFTRGALLGDRIRMSEWYNNPSVFIRSLSSRGSLGGLSPKIIEITDILKAAPFDYIIVETVGVGQSEVEVAGLADTVLVLVVPGAGDEIQTMKAGLMEIANIFVVNKADRPGANELVKDLRSMLSPAFSKTSVEIPILKTIATQKEGIIELAAKIIQHPHDEDKDKKIWLLTEKCYQLIQKKKMTNIRKDSLFGAIKEKTGFAPFNLYQFVIDYLEKHP